MKSPNPSAPPIFANEAVANPAQTARPGRQYSLYCAPCLRGPTEGRPHRIRYSLIGKDRVRSGPAFRKGFGGAA